MLNFTGRNSWINANTDLCIHLYFLSFLYRLSLSRHRRDSLGSPRKPTVWSSGWTRGRCVRFTRPSTATASEVGPDSSCRWQQTKASCTHCSFLSCERVWLQRLSECHWTSLTINRMVKHQQWSCKCIFTNKKKTVSSTVKHKGYCSWFSWYWWYISSLKTGMFLFFTRTHYGL